MTIHMTSLSPANYVAELVAPGLTTSTGAVVALRQYVSSAARSPLASLVREQLDALARQTGGAQRELAALRARCMAVDASQWRRLFTGTGDTALMVSLWDWLLAHSDLLRALPAPLPGSAGWSDWFAQVNPIQAMVDSEIFGLDCLGFVSGYLRRAGLMLRAPTWNVEQFATVAMMREVPEPSAVRPLALLLFPVNGEAGTAQHIAIVDRVDALVGGGVRVDLCQSSRNGPQLNQRVVLAPAADETIVVGGHSFRRWTFAQGGSPPAPVQNPFMLVHRPGWQLRAGPG